MLELEKTIRLDKAAIQATNLADKFSERDLTRIGTKVSEGYEMDVDSRSAWFQRTEAAMDLAMQVTKAKSFPWPNASNVIFPLVTIAALQFHSRAYPAIVQGSNVVKCKVGMAAGPDGLTRADRVGRFMSYQLLEEDSAWEEQHDKTLLNISIVGSAFKKSYFNPTLGHNTSELVLARDFVINYYAKDVASARRKTHRVPLYRNEIWERAAAGVYRDCREDSWFKAPAQQTNNPAPGQQDADARHGSTPATNDDAAPFWALEQHVWLDLDGDGYEEPYIILVEEASNYVLRIVSRVSRDEDISRNAKGEILSIQAEEYFTKYSFIPSPDGGIYDIGLGVLLGPLNESVNTLVNQLVDAGTMANTAGGFLGRGAKIRGGVYTFSPFEWKRVDSTGEDLNKSIVPLKPNAPSEVLFKLLTLIIDFTGRISGATEMMAGENPGQNTKVGVADQMVEQGEKIYAAIFKRIWRSMKEEFKKLYVLNAIHLPQSKPGPGGIVIMREDFLGDPNQIVPVADPNVVSTRIRVARATALTQRAMQVPGYDMAVVETRWLQAMEIESPETVYVGIEKTGPLPNPKMMVEGEKTKREMLKLKQASEIFLFEMEEQHSVNEAHIQQLEAQATKLLSEAKGLDVNAQINAINASVGALKAHNESLAARAKVILDSMELEHGHPERPGPQGAARTISALAGASGHPALPGPAGAGGGGQQGGMGLG